MDEFLALTLALGHRAAGTFNIGTGATVCPLQKHDARPDVDRVLVLAREVLIETREQKLLDSGLTVRLSGLRGRAGW